MELLVIFQKQKNFNMAVYSFFQTFCPLILVRTKLFPEFQ